MRDNECSLQFGALTPLEPRLGKKLIEPLTNLIHSTSAMSLLYECINTVIAVLISISSGMPNHSDSIQLCVQKLRILIEDSDQNLKYLGLLAMSKILKTHPKSVQAHKDLIMQCLDDKDESIRLRALDLLYGMVSKKNLMEIVRKLMVHMDKAEGTTYRDELLSKIIQICSQNNYQFITYFEWYISVLVELTRMEGTKHGKLVATQLLDVAIRVQAIRKYAVQQCALLLDNAHLLIGGQPRATMSEVLYAAAWICGEFSSELDDPLAILCSMLRSQAANLPGHIQAVYVHNILKLAASTLSKAEKDGDVETMEQIYALKEKISAFVCSGDLEVQERSSSALVLLECLKENPGLANELMETFVGELNPVAPKAQRKVQIPEGLDLDAWINDPPSDSSDSEDPDINDIFVKADKSSEFYDKRKSIEPTPEELQERREARKLEQQNNPHYLKGSNTSAKNSRQFNNAGADNNEEEFDKIPVAELNIPVTLNVPGFADSSKYLSLSASTETSHKKRHSKKKKSKKSIHLSSSDEEQDEKYPSQLVNTGAGELPPGAELSDGDDFEVGDENDPHRFLDFDLDVPLRDDERLSYLELQNPNKYMKILRTDDEKVKKEKKGHRKSKKKSKVLKEKNEKNGKTGEENANDTDLWLASDTSPEKVRDSGAGDYVEVPEATTTKSEKSKKTKKSKSRDKQKKGNNEEDSKHRKKLKKSKDRSTKKSSGYEETAGISTPSKEILPNLNNDSNGSEVGTTAGQGMSMYEELVKDKTIKLMYELKQLPHETDRLIASIMLINDGEHLVKEMDFDVSDTSTLKLVRSPGDEFGVKLRFQLAPKTTGEAQFAILVSDVTFAQKLKGTFTYMVESPLGIVQEKLDFTMYLPCSSFMVGRLSHRDILTELLGGGQLTQKIRKEFEPHQEFSQILSSVCYKCHLTLVEQVNDTASVYGHSLKGHHVCLLLKQNKSGTLTIEGKSDNNALLLGIIDEISRILT
ncbi:AP-3 complex subunit delta-1 isoform X2 [Cephus cinctus]|uniref:AP-3 complex subunit delta-1 isoform X2 n=1 Tax=Cephus cinctus TaxID=211228 RepID=A0AAJ7W5F2_CEPCN|nr:AP-3 complex subunit delta-1 isoform X2 [Cephus cinctus]